MALFIGIDVDPALAGDKEAAAKLCEVCPVSIFAQDDSGKLRIVDRNVDECTLCELCLAIGKPGQIKVIKKYDGDKPLERSS